MEEERHPTEDTIKEDIYTEEGREILVDKEDEINDIGEGFMKGYEEGEKTAKCPLCHEVIEFDFIEKEIDGEVYRFCSDYHLEEFLKKKEENLT